jgi:hypothetical protein
MTQTTKNIEKRRCITRIHLLKSNSFPKIWAMIGLWSIIEGSVCWSVLYSEEFFILDHFWAYTMTKFFDLLPNVS